MSKTYNRLAAGERLRLKRTLLGMTQEEMAERIDRVPKYYADIERGSCGMSVETLMALSHTLNMPMDYIILGREYGENSEKKHEDEIVAVLDILDKCPEKQRASILKIIKIFISSCAPLSAEIFRLPIIPCNPWLRFVIGRLSSVSAETLAIL